MDLDRPAKLGELTFFILCSFFADIFALANSNLCFSDSRSLRSLIAVRFLKKISVKARGFFG